MKTQFIANLIFLFFSANTFAQSQEFETSGTYTVPANVTLISIEVYGAGGGGGSNGSGGGGGGGYAKGTFSVTAGSQLSVTIGTGGTAFQSGGTTMVGSLISATGGSGGSQVSNPNVGGGGTGGQGVGGSINRTGGNGGGGYFTYTGGGGGGSAGPDSDGSNGGDTNGGTIPMICNNPGGTGGASGGGFAGAGGKGGGFDDSNCTIVNPNASGSNYGGGGGGGNGSGASIGANGANGYAIITVESVLPVTWLDATQAVNMNGVIEITFSTAQQINNSHFEIGRSEDGLFFNKIGEINGERNSLLENHYRFIDDSPSHGLNYYRIKQVDFDGKYSYSNISSVNFGVEQIQIFPNPTSGQFFIITEVSQTLEIYNQLGQNLKIFEVLKGENSFDISDIRNGVYILKMNGKVEMLVKR